MDKNEAWVGMKVVSVHPKSEALMKEKGLKFITLIGVTDSGRPVTNLAEADSYTTDGINGYSHHWKSLIPYRSEQTIYIRIKD